MRFFLGGTSLSFSKLVAWREARIVELEKAAWPKRALAIDDNGLSALIVPMEEYLPWEHSTRLQWAAQA